MKNGPKREKVETVTLTGGGSYFTSAKVNLQFVSTGCTLLDCALGGGFVLGRIANIVGDKSTAKTALATEALINFMMAYPEGVAAYRDSEAAFDLPYAEAMGLPSDKVEFGIPINTVEDFERDFDAFLDKQLKERKPGIYVLDSLDALSDEAEMEQDIGKGTYGQGKAKQTSRLFRTLKHKIEQSKVLLVIVSQVRENIGVSFGEKYRRSGGKALDFYASQIMWLAHIGQLKKTVNKVERPYGIKVKASIKKNKVALPFRTAEFSFIFGYGVEDLKACVDWLKEVNRLKDANIEDYKEYIEKIDDMTSEQYRKEQALIASITKQVWADVETTFLPKRSKYG